MSKRVVAGLAVAAALSVAAGTALIVNAQPSGYGNFQSNCAYDHSAPDDPIVHPDMPGASHLHDFFGAKNVDAFTKPADKVDGPTTCGNPKATGAYWVPALYNDGVKVDPVQAVGNYSAGAKLRSTIQPFPVGLVMVAGSLVPPAGPTGSDRVDWSCGRQPYSQNNEFAGCINPSDTLTIRLPFPDCWDGVHLDSADHRSHMAYSVRPKGTTSNVCPADHPVPVVQLSLRVLYGANLAGPVTLASGPSNTWHADFMNSWDQGELSRLVSTCIVGQVNCQQD